MPTPPASVVQAELMGALPLVLQRLVAPLLDEPPLPLDALERTTTDYLRHLERQSHHHEFIDLALAQAIADSLTGLLAHLGDAPSDDAHRCVHAAVRYFEIEDDAESDVDSLLGLDDDAEVVSAVARVLGRPDLIVRLP